MIGMMHASIKRGGSGSENFPSLCEKKSFADPSRRVKKLTGMVKH